MSKKIPESEFVEILEKLKLFKEGASLKEIKQSIEIPFFDYTLQRRLTSLVKSGLMRRIGKGRAQKYLLPSNTNESEASIFEEEDPIDQIIPLSEESKIVLNIIEKPDISRNPVGYNRKFLDEYRPNVSFYLSQSQREKLLKLGKTDGDQPAGTYAREIFNRLLIELSWNSSRLEGNTYSLLETERLLDLNEVGEGKDLKDTQMIINHKEAIEFLVESTDLIAIDRYTVLNVHALLSNNLLKDTEACGRVRSKSVGIKKSVYHPLVIPSLINECFNQVLDTARAIKNPFEQAFFLMVHLPYLQPFEDVNKRVSRLVANIPLILLNLCPLSFMNVPRKTYIKGLLAIYELNNVCLLRDVFIWAYERSCALYSVTLQNLGEPDPFRMKYKNMIFEIVSNVVREPLDKKKAIAFIKQKTKDIPENDQQSFLETVEMELRGLHEGNIARYKLRPSEYEIWHKTWK